MASMYQKITRAVFFALLAVFSGVSWIVLDLLGLEWNLWVQLAVGIGVLVLALVLSRSITR